MSRCHEGNIPLRVGPLLLLLVAGMVGLAVYAVPAGEPPAVAQPAARPPASVTLDLWGFGREGRLLGSLIPRFEELHPGIRIRLHVIPKQGIHEKLVTAAIGGTLPDLAHVSATWVAAWLTKVAKI